MSRRHTGVLLMRKQLIAGLLLTGAVLFGSAAQPAAAVVTDDYDNPDWQPEITYHEGVDGNPGWIEIVHHSSAGGETGEGGSDEVAAAGITPEPATTAIGATAAVAWLLSVAGRRRR